MTDPIEHWDGVTMTPAGVVASGDGPHQTLTDRSASGAEPDKLPDRTLIGRVAEGGAVAVSGGDCTVNPAATVWTPIGQPKYVPQPEPRQMTWPCAACLLALVVIVIAALLIH